MATVNGNIREYSNFGVLIESYNMLRKLFHILFLFILFSCSTDKRETLFSLLSSQDTGIKFVNTIHETEISNILTYEYYYNGGGVAVGDINNDGLIDIYFTSNLFSNKLYLNQGNFQFKDITEQSNTGCDVGWKTGVSMVDINNDGLLDIYICRSASPETERRRNILLVNNGDLTFTERAKEYNLDDPSFSTHSAFFDYDNDGDLDLLLLNHSRLPLSNSYSMNKRYENKRVNHVGNKLYRNDIREKGVFTDVSDSMGIYGPVSNYGLGVAIGDLNKDGWPDLYTSNDFTEKDKLYLNNKGKFFNEVSDSLLTSMSVSSMGVDMADLNNNGLLDIISLDMLPEPNNRQKGFFWQHKYKVYEAMVEQGLHHQYMRNMLHINNGDGTFSEIGEFLKMSNTDWSWAPLIADFDNDGNQDVFITNGFKKNFNSNDFLKIQGELIGKIKSGQSSESLIDILNLLPEYKEHDYMFRNMGDLEFIDVSYEWGFEMATLSNGVAYADLDNDGDLDLIVNCVDQEALIYRNNTDRKGNNFLKIKLTGSNENPSGLGTEITLHVGGQMYFRSLNPYRGFQSSVEPLLFFGLGKNEMIDSLIAQWPDGNTQKIINVKANQSMTLNHSDSKKQTEPITKAKDPALFTQAGAIDFTHRENDFVDFKSQPLLPRMYSTMGPAAALSKTNDYLYIGGAKGQAGQLFIQNAKSGFKKVAINIFENDRNSEDVDAIFFDMDNDGDEDLYVVSGGNEFAVNDPLLQDRLYENIGGDKFIKRSLPDFLVSGSCVRPADIDLDGDLDLFIGGRIVPGRYPEAPSSHILLNDGNGNFTVSTSEIATGIIDIGMVTDAAWIDLNRDQYPELIITGEWMPITVFENKQGKLRNATDQYIPEKTEGWWSTLLVEDFDNDGDQDFMAGNFGLNQQYRPTSSQPMELYYDDYDGNGTIDPIINYYIGDASYPMPIRDELMEQLPSFKKRFPDYRSYSNATINDILSKEEIKNSTVLKAVMFETCFFRNDGGKFTIHPLPKEAQFSPIFSMVAMDVNYDGNLDVITGGNITAMPLRFGRVSANFGAIFLGNGKGGFTYLPSMKSGVTVRGDVRKILRDNNQVIYILNNDTPAIYAIEEYE